MPNKYRTCQRINKSKQYRLEKREEKAKNESRYNSIYEIENYFEAYSNSLKNVKWKGNVQRSMAAPIRVVEEPIFQYRNGNFKVPINTTREIIYERGKARNIVPIKFTERIIEHVLCDKILLPIYENRLIYSNGASLKGKGTEFSRTLMNDYLIKAIRQGYQYAVQFDVKSYFDSIPHITVYKILSRDIKDQNIVELIMNIVLSYKHGNISIDYKNKRITKEEYDKRIKDLYDLKDCGVCLGSQISQILALVVLNDLDHYIKDNLRMKYYIRYMDDGIILCKTKEEAQYVLEWITKQIEKVGLTFSEKKTKITKLSKGFVFLKVIYRVKDGKIIKKLHPASVSRMRKKLKKFVHLVNKENRTEQDVFNSMQSWWSHSFVAKSYHTRKKMLENYKQHFTYKVDWFEARMHSMKPKAM